MQCSSPDTTGQLTLKSALAGPDRARWEAPGLRNGTPRPDGTKTVRFSSPKDKPAHRMSSYLSTAVKIKLKPDGTREFRAQHLRRRPL
jgi:hypothetical protein